MLLTGKTWNAPFFNRNICSTRRKEERVVSRSNELLLPFSFWGQPPEREPGNLYELRSYHLRPGTLIEWANNWSRGISHRREQDEAVAGMFCQIGDLYVVHHLWAYKDLQTRKDIREAAWRKPGWDECVAYTGKGYPVMVN
ncbi:hypothetical protein BSL78_09355 [Apostichopus japonicus]|uniref:NIPSNAP domain-containing protein n=1 Tax=Stichopus japonicus TaxID=307972 RepID=A0A2G8L0N6_STIJA|nr:hypothetical protein BSL78_09355 [Apostichopus japonicus]